MHNIFKISLSLLATAYILTGCSNSNETKDKVSQGNISTEFFVRGNCGMCEERIENTAKKLDGVAVADYNVENKLLKVSYDSTKTNELTIHKAVASAGHETKEVPMDEKAHEALPECCKKGFVH